MSITIKQLEMWSKAKEKVVKWNLAIEDETDEGGNIHTAIVARYGDEFHKFSPSMTDAELERQAKQINEEK